MTYIIAEIGINHEGILKKAKHLIKNAKQAGADAVKFQLFETETLATKYKINKNDKLYNMWKKVTLKESDVKKLKKYSIKNKINFFCSVFDKRSLEMVNRLGIKIIKVASSDLTDDVLLLEIAKTKKKVLLSTGMASEAEINRAMNILKNNNVTLMHCVSLYPCLLKEANLSRIISLKRKFKNTMIGYSDHCKGTKASIASISIGAKVIEKHFTDNKTRKGFDHNLSADFKDLKDIVQFAKEFKYLKGSGKIDPSKKEIKMRNFARKSIYYKSNYKKGYILKIKDLVIKRPLASFEPKDIHRLLKKKLRCNVSKDLAVKKNHIS